MKFNIYYLITYKLTHEIIVKYITLFIIFSNLHFTDEGLTKFG